MRIPRPRRRWWLPSVVLVLVAVAGVGAWLLTRADDEAAVAATTTTTVTTSTLKQTVAATGTIAPARSEELGFEVSGTVTAVEAAVGDAVRKGQVIARLDASTLRSRLAAARSAATAAAEQLAEDEDDDASDTQLAADESAVLAARADVDQAESDVESAVLRAPFRGVVTTLDLAVGDVVGSSASSGSAGGTGDTGGQGDSSGTTGTESTSTSESTAAVTVVTARRFVLDATVASSDVDALSEGLQAEITVTGLDETVYGVVTEIGLVAESSSSGAAVFPVTIEVTAPPEDLYAGSSAEAAIVVEQVDDALTVPSRALASEGDATYVNLVVDGKTVRTEVEVGEVYGDQTQVLSGVSEGDEIEVPGFVGRGGGSGGQQGEDGSGGMPGSGEMPAGGFPAGGMPGGNR